jgi:hypothetical protein
MGPSSRSVPCPPAAEWRRKTMRSLKGRPGPNRTLRAMAGPISQSSAVLQCRVIVRPGPGGDGNGLGDAGCSGSLRRAVKIVRNWVSAASRPG